VEPGIDRVQQGYLVLVDIHAENVVAYLGHARGVDRTQVTSSDH
jgi:hypothetical protein